MIKTVLKIVSLSCLLVAVVADLYLLVISTSTSKPLSKTKSNTPTEADLLLINKAIEIISLNPRQADETGLSFIRSTGSNSAVIEDKQISIQVFNASGIAGKAGEYKDLLEGLGLNLVVSIGNTEGNQPSVIKFKDNVISSVSEKILTLIRGRIDGIQVGQLADSESNDIVLIIGD